MSDQPCPHCRGTGKVPAAVARCSRCECPLAADESYLCRSCGEEEDAEVEARIRDDEEAPRCGCRYCFCLERTECGEVCAMCASGGHQG